MGQTSNPPPDASEAAEALSELAPLMAEIRAIATGKPSP